MAKRFTYLVVVCAAAVGVGVALKPDAPSKYRPVTDRDRDFAMMALGDNRTAQDKSQALDAVHMAELARGVYEIPPGSNDAPRIREYQDSARSPHRTAWCAAYTYWVHSQAGVAAYRSAWCPDWAKHGRRIYEHRKYKREPLPGDWILTYGVEAKRYNHIASIHDSDGKYWITIGGNESNRLRMGRVLKDQVTYIGTYID